MIFEIQPPDNLIEASVSTDPDDVNEVSIRIDARLTDDEQRQLDDDADDDPFEWPSIEFVVADDITTSPDTISPQAENFDAWEMAVAGGGRFVANARVPRPPGSQWRFALRDVAVATGDGVTNVTVTEVTSSGRTAHVLPVTKFVPGLRIDHFRVVGASDAPLDAETTSTKSVTLAWATTAATTVTLHGPDADLPKTWTDGNGSETVNPTTMSVYTLVATSSSAHAVAQVTINVTDQLKSGKVEGTTSVKAPLLEATGSTGRAKAPHIEGTTDVKAPLIEATGTPGRLKGVEVEAVDRVTIGNWTIASNENELIVVAHDSYWWRLVTHGGRQLNRPGISGDPRAILPEFEYGGHEVTDQGPPVAVHAPGTRPIRKIKPLPLPEWYQP